MSCEISFCNYFTSLWPMNSKRSTHLGPTLHENNSYIS